MGELSLRRSCAGYGTFCSVFKTHALMQCAKSKQRRFWTLSEDDDKTICKLECNQFCPLSKLLPPLTWPSTMLTRGTHKCRKYCATWEISKQHTTEKKTKYSRIMTTCTLHSTYKHHKLTWPYSGQLLSTHRKFYYCPVSNSLLLLLVCCLTQLSIMHLRCTCWSVKLWKCFNKTQSFGSFIRLSFTWQSIRLFHNSSPLAPSLTNFPFTDF